MMNPSEGGDSTNSHKHLTILDMKPVESDVIYQTGSHFQFCFIIIIRPYSSTARHWPIPYCAKNLAPRISSSTRSIHSSTSSAAMLYRRAVNQDGPLEDRLFSLPSSLCNRRDVSIRTYLIIHFPEISFRT